MSASELRGWMAASLDVEEASALVTTADADGDDLVTQTSSSSWPARRLSLTMATRMACGVRDVRGRCGDGGVGRWGNSRAVHHTCIS
jgi:hypothetical protein